ncbi:MAG: glycosyltransferase family 2 protein [Candidatus Omnitrophica bacterium]|nr:glycosyltransferase family 2 protein [Candidatus Omnitrophota bacterium]MCM8790567.1 glycosyltransferase family 2 protein [Candidatus Omnitrophota bacterium]
MKCDIIIPIWNQPEHTRACIENLIKNTRYPYRLILVDNGSAAATAEYLRGLKIDGVEKVLIRNEQNLGFVKAVNQGLQASSAPYVCVLNNDTIPAPGWLERLVEFAEAHKDAGLLNPVCDGHLDTPIEEYAKRLEANKGRYMEMNQCFGFCMLIKREVIDKIGYLDEAFGIGGFDDTDYSMRAHKAGYRCVSVHDAYVYHKQHATFNVMGDRKRLVSPGEKTYFQKWPRHLRIGWVFAIDDSISDADIKNVLDGVLFLAREWCWVNLWVFGDREANKKRLAAISSEARIPLHQNIKYNFLPDIFRQAQALARLIERSFGTKARKRYDAMIVVGKDNPILLTAFYPIHRAFVCRVDIGEDMKKKLQAIIERTRTA